MHKVLQAIIDTFLLAAGSVELGSAAYSPNPDARVRHHHVAKPLPEPDLATEKVSHPEPQPYAGEPTLRTSAEKSRF